MCLCETVYIHVYEQNLSFYSSGGQKAGTCASMHRLPDPLPRTSPHRLLSTAEFRASPTPRIPQNLLWGAKKWLLAPGKDLTSSLAELEVGDLGHTGLLWQLQRLMLHPTGISAAAGPLSCPAPLKQKGSGSMKTNWEVHLLVEPLEAHRSWAQSSGSGSQLPTG